MFCYDYLDNFDRLDEKTLPSREQFFSKLTNSNCSQEEYAHALRVWTEYRCNTLGDYMRLYLLTDICILADAFETFRANSLNEYQLDPAYYMSAPQLAWSALLKFIDKRINLITDPEMYRMIQPNVRGGICHVSVRYARANNKLLGSLYDPTKPTSYILFVDANNLYGWALSQPMPEKNMEWLTELECQHAELELQEKQTRDQFFAYHANSLDKYRRLGLEAEQTGDVESQAKLMSFEEKLNGNTPPLHFIFEVDLEYPPEQHERDDDYPMAPELMTITTNITGPKQHKLQAKYYAASCPFSRKLVCSFLPKKHYVVLGHMLRFYLDRGMRLTKVHRGIKFCASNFIADYIENNTKKRNMYKTDEVKKNFYKLMNNSVYGKTIENAAKRSDIRLLNDDEKARQLAEKPHCVDFRLFNENLIGIEMRKAHHFINKPFQVGFSVLEWSKYKMYTFFAKLKDTFGEKVRMLYTDTDSFFLQFFVEDLATELNRDPSMREWFDFGEVPANHVSGLGSAAGDPHAGVIGYFKDESKGDQVYEVIALRPKSYSIQTVKATRYDPEHPEAPPPAFKHKVVAKGITRENIKRLTHEDYRQMLEETECRDVTNRRIESKLHQVIL